MLAERGSKNTVKVLKGGYELFSGMYPFLRTQQIIYMPKVYRSVNFNGQQRQSLMVFLFEKVLELFQTYPSEIIPGLLYLGNLNHASQAYVKKDLKLKAYVNCTNANNNE